MKTIFAVETCVGLHNNWRAPFGVTVSRCDSWETALARAAERANLDGQLPVLYAATERSVEPDSSARPIIRFQVPVIAA